MVASRDEGAARRESGAGSAPLAHPTTLFITNDFPPRIGGAQSYYWGVIQTLDPSRVTILAPAHPDAAAFDATHPYRVIRAETTVLWPTRSLLRQATRLAAEQRAQLIQLGHPLPAGLLGPQLKERCGLPYIVFLGGSEVTIPAAVPGLSRLLGHVLENAAMLLTVSEYTAHAARRHVQGKVRVEVLRPPLQTDVFVPATAEESAALRRRLSIDGQLVVCLGRLVPRKGQDTLIDALALLGGEFPTLHLALVGEGRMMTRLYDRAQRRGVGDRVHLTGALVDSAVRQWLQAADVFASPVRTRWGGFEVEGFGIVFAEAALSGLPVVAGRSGGSPEAVMEAVTGTVVNGRSPTDVAAGLATLLRVPPQRRREMGLEGRKLAMGRHAPAVVAARYRRLLGNAAGIQSV